jgi:hypothetical protein
MFSAGSLGIGLQMALGVALTAALVRAQMWLSARRQAAARWPTVQGVILSSRFTYHRRKNRDSDDHWELKVLYRYRVRGQDYESDRVQWGGNLRAQSERETDRLLAAYPEGGAVKVYYRSDKPDVAVLDPLTNSGSVVLLVLIVFSLVLNGFILWLHFGT